MKTVRLRDGTKLTALAQGAPAREEEVATIRAGLALGLNVIDTAETYAAGLSERLVAKAVRGIREKAFLVSKAHPDNASRAHLTAACEASLRRLETDRIDLYLLHWREQVSLGEIIEGMERLIAAGKIVRWGVSNFDVADMTDLQQSGGANCAVNQILFNLAHREAERDLLPLLSHHGVLPMAYSPVDRGRLLQCDRLVAFALARGWTPAQVALAWLLRGADVMPVCKAGSLAHLNSNVLSLTINLDADDYTYLDTVFAKPMGKATLSIL